MSTHQAQSTNPSESHSSDLERLLDKQRIREVIENWVVFRDSGKWEEFKSVWHSDGVMMATWFQGPFEEFIKVSIEGWNKGVSILHFLGGSSVELSSSGTRAIAQTKMTITQRGLVDGHLCDVVCTGRFYDFMEKRAGRWGVVLRQPIYEKDRINPLDPSANFQLDQDLLMGFPEGYRHLAYIQTRLGFKVKEDMPQLKGNAVEELYQRGKQWNNHA